MKTVDVTIRDVTADAAFHLPVLADLFCPFDPEADDLLGDEALSDMDYWSALEHVLERMVRRQEELLEALQGADRLFTPIRQQACHSVTDAVCELAELLRLYQRHDFATIIAEWPLDAEENHQ